MEIQGAKARQFPGLVPDLISTLSLWPGRRFVRRWFMRPNALPNSFFGVIISQGFQTDKPLFSRWPDSDIFSCLDGVTLLFQIGQEMLKEKGMGNAGVHIPADLPVPCSGASMTDRPCSRQSWSEVCRMRA